jgi:hypothetical protein
MSLYLPEQALGLSAVVPLTEVHMHKAHQLETAEQADRNPCQTGQVGHNPTAFA